MGEGEEGEDGEEDEDEAEADPADGEAEAEAVAETDAESVDVGAEVDAEAIRYSQEVFSAPAIVANAPELESIARLRTGIVPVVPREMYYTVADRTQTIERKTLSRSEPVNSGQREGKGGGNGGTSRRKRRTTEPREEEIKGGNSQI